ALPTSPIRPCRKPSVPSCCPIRKILITIPTKIPILLGKSNRINFSAVRIILYLYVLSHSQMDNALDLRIDQYAGILAKAYFKPPDTSVANFPRFVVKDRFILKDWRQEDDFSVSNLLIAAFLYDRHFISDFVSVCKQLVYFSVNHPLFIRSQLTQDSKSFDCPAFFGIE